jgi:2-methylisocitrate lyase-like PEP mutase family enzyme
VTTRAGGAGTTLPSVPSPLTPVDRRARVAALRSALSAAEPLVVPGATDALGARLVERAGFAACYATGAGAANVAWGVPDVGLPTLTEMAEHVGRMARAVGVPVIADADDGYGGPLSVMRTVAALEAAGAAAVQLEDQASPKRCGHFVGKRLVPVEEMVAKLLAANRVRTEGTVVIARTDAVAVEGFDAAVARARLYAEAGADVLFVEAPETMEQLRALPRLLPDRPLVANVVPGGRTPELSSAELAERGFHVVLHANLLMRTMVHSGQRALEYLAATGTSAGWEDAMLPWGDRQELVQLSLYDALEEDLRRRAAALVGRQRQHRLEQPGGDLRR